MNINLRIGGPPAKRRRKRPALTLGKLIVALMLALAAIAGKMWKDRAGTPGPAPAPAPAPAGTPK